jgi:hypothetical protein
VCFFSIAHTHTYTYISTFLLMIFLFLFLIAPPEIVAEKTWIHAAEGCDIQLVCTLHGDVNSEVNNFPSLENN